MPTSQWFWLLKVSGGKEQRYLKLIAGLQAPKLVVVVDTKKETLTLSERIFTCDVCSFTCDRDLNASYPRFCR